MILSFKTFTRRVGAVVLLLIYFILSADLVQAQLPQIELPEYIISGVEKATFVKGERLPSEIVPVITFPAAPTSIKPALTASQDWLATSDIRPIQELFPGYWHVSANTGTFKMLGIGGGLIHTGKNISRAANIGLQNEQHRIRAGNELSWQVGYGEVHRFKRDISIYPTLTFRSEGVTLLDSSGDHQAIRSDFAADLFLQPYMTQLGMFNSHLQFVKWGYSSIDDLSGVSTSIRLSHGIEISDGRLETTLGFNSESVAEDDIDLWLGVLSSHYSFLLYPSLLVWLGGTIYAGESVQGEKRQGIQPHVKAEIPLSFGGNLSFAYQPQAKFIASESTWQDWNVIDYWARGNIEEEVNDFSLGYKRLLAPNLELNAAGFVRRTRHALFAVPDSMWFPVLRTLNSTGIELTCGYTVDYSDLLKIYIKYEAAETDGTGDGNEAPQIPELTASIFGGYTHWSLDFTTDLTWSGKAPVDFTGSIERPERLIWNFAVGKTFNKVGVVLGMKNILNEKYHDFPRYDMPPLTIYLQAGYKSNWK